MSSMMSFHQGELKNLLDEHTLKRLESASMRSDARPDKTSIINFTMRISVTIVFIFAFIIICSIFWMTGTLNITSVSQPTLLAVISLAGVAFSGILSLIISIRQSNVTVQRYRDEIESKFADKLFDRRIDNYPALFRLISDLAKKLNKNEIDASYLKKTFSNIEGWDSDNAILLSPTSFGFLGNLRSRLNNYMEHTCVDSTDQEIVADSKKKLILAISLSN